MLGLVVPHAHPQPRADAAANGRQPQQHALWNPPPRPLRLPLVDAVQEKREDIDNYKGKMTTVDLEISFIIISLVNDLS